MPSLPLDPRPGRTPADRAAEREPAPRAAQPAPPAQPAPVDPETERARRRDRRTGVVALIVASVVLWALIAAAVAFAATR
ncbi:hypothetical protein C5B94_00810 [Clavibacter michiganensis]|uniref:hypothetical protein n=1 Tax=Clavibacter michiganensis TaxID=28447 RepID=UPI000CE7FB3D|nr:hypothetical protein [Clavibacter michiganensis]PPF57866.1 hypothetical protein C5B94_00810 [Clavibacter michiganensis]